MADQGEQQRALGFWLCLALVVGNFIGSGIFLLPAQLAPFGWNSVFGWLLTVGGGLCLAFVFARLAAALPRAAGPYAFVGEAFGPAPAFAVAWSYWISVWVGNTAIAIAAISYLSLFLPQLTATPGLGALAAAGLLWILTAVNCLSVRAGGRVQLVTVLIKLIPLIVVIVVAGLVVAQGRQAVSIPLRANDLGLGAINRAAALTLWAMLGVECASVASRNVRDPSRNVPRATLIGTLLVGALYLLASTPITLLLPADAVAHSDAPFALFVVTYWNPTVARWIGLFAAISAIGAMNGFVLLQGELPLAMARGGAFPAWFAKTAANGAAVRAQILSSLLATVLIAANASRSVAGLFQFMALLATAATLVLYLACALSALRLQQSGKLERSAMLTIVAVIAAAYGLWTLYGAGAEATGWGAVLLAFGIPVYLLMRWLRLKESPAALSSRNVEAASMNVDDRQKSEREWRESLSDEQYRVLREAGTEPAFTGRYVDNHDSGEYLCAGCGETLFDSGTKFDSGSGWPSFTQPAGEAVAEHADTSHGMRRVEVRCGKCDGHLGHVFPDGPGPTGLRYCINSASLDFKPRRDD